jgi:thymidine kinase
MNSGKSGMLLMQAHQFEERNIPFLCLKSIIDTRDGEDVIVSRVGIKRECISINVGDNIYDLIYNYTANAILEGMEKPLWVLVDECQFLSRDQVDQLAMIVDKLNINVMCYGLRTDFTTNLFEGSKRLMELADSIEEVKTLCHCGRKAVVNARFNNGELVTDGEQIVIGGNDMYTSICRKCYFELLEKKLNKEKEYYC